MDKEYSGCFIGKSKRLASFVSILRLPYKYIRNCSIQWRAVQLCNLFIHCCHEFSIEFPWMYAWNWQCEAVAMIQMEKYYS